MDIDKAERPLEEIKIKGSAQAEAERRNGAKDDDKDEVRFFP
jgi:hypothetical protein